MGRSSTAWTQREDRGVGADAKAERQDRGQREDRRVEQRTHGVTEIVDQCGHSASGVRRGPGERTFMRRRLRWQRVEK